MTATYSRRVQYVISCDTCTLLRVVYNPIEAEQLLADHNAPGVCEPAPYSGGDPAPFQAKPYDGGGS